MPVIAAHEFTIDQLKNLGILKDPAYNGFDNCITFQVDEARQRLGRNDTLIYDFEIAMQAAALEMMLRGFLVDKFSREDAIILTANKAAHVERIIKALVTAVQGTYNSKLPGSPKQIINLLYNVMKLNPITKTVNGELKYPMDRETLEKLETKAEADDTRTNYKFARPIIKSILFFRDLRKTLQVLETEIDNDWRWRCSYNIGGTTTGRWSSSKSPFGTGCVLPHVEALTPTGWKRVDKLSKWGDEIIAQWNPTTNSIEWSNCEIWSQDFSGEMLRVQTEQIKQTLTPNHRVPRYDINIRNLYTEFASEVSQLSQEVLPLGAKYRHGETEIPAYAAMLMADFHKEPSGWRAQFTKKRKIDRFLSLAQQYNLDFGEQKASRNEDRKFVVRGHQDFPKKWGRWILDLTYESAKDLLEEARYWDATDRGSGFIFFTKDEDQAMWFATLAHLVGRSATMRLVQQNEGSYSTTPMWWVNVKSRNHTRVMKKHWTKIPYEGKVYCPKVKSSYWLMREDKFISVSGNSNFQNINEELRRIFIPDPGYKLYGIDKSQSEARDVGWFCGTTLGDWTYLDACESGDLHTAVTRLLYPEKSWTGDLKKDKSIAQQRFYRKFTYRDASKRLAHASNYFGKPKEISRQTRIPLPLVESFQQRYFSAFPCIAKMHQWIIQHVQRHRYLVNSFGRRRDFFDRPESYETIKSAIAYMFQSATGDCLNLGLWRLQKHMHQRIQILSQLHDAVYFQAKTPDSDADEQALLRDCLSLIQVTQTDARSGRRMTIPAEVSGGWNWAHRYRLDEAGNLEDWNPRGLVEIKIN